MKSSYIEQKEMVKAAYKGSIYGLITAIILIGLK